MKTSKPIATISYNSEAFLKDKISQLKSSGFISYAMWVFHKAEEGEKKDHFHVYLEPSKMLQTDDLVNCFKELDSDYLEHLRQIGKSLEDLEEEEKKKLHLGCMVFRNSQATDWLLYGLHDERYLMDKGLSKAFHYEPSDVHSTCDITFSDILAQANDLRNNKLEQRIFDAVIEKNWTWFQIVKSGMIPLNKISGALTMYKTLTGQMDVDKPKYAESEVFYQPPTEAEMCIRSIKHK